MLIAALVLARIIAESGTAAPSLDDGDVLLIKRHDVVIGEGCSGGDAGVSDAGTDGAGPADAGLGDGGPTDAGPDDGGSGDAAIPDAGCEAIPGDAVTLMVQPRFSELTTGARFALLMVTPARPIVETQSAYVFSELAQVTAPQVIVHETKIQDPAMGKACDLGGGGGCGFAPSEPGPSFTPPGLGDGGLGDTDGGFTVDTIGPYEVVRAQPADTAELQTWLAGLGYLTLPADLAAVAPYITRGYTVVAIRVKVETTTNGQLSPIALTWPGSELRLPVALGAPAGAAAHETNVYIAGPGPYVMTGAAMPFAYRTSWGDEGFLTKNVLVLDGDGDPDHDPVATPILGEIAVRETRDEYRDVHVPVSDCGEIGCGCGECSAQRPVRGDLVIVGGVVAFVLARKRRFRRVCSSAQAPSRSARSPR